jgi:hypothetical protein
MTYMKRSRLALGLFSMLALAGLGVWIGAAGGGVWRTTNALAGTPSWTFVSGSRQRHRDADGRRGDGTLYAGTGDRMPPPTARPGSGLFKSTDGSWSLTLP